MRPPASCEPLKEKRIVSHPFDVQHRTSARILTAIVSVGLVILSACGPSQSAKKTDENDAKVTSAAKAAGVKRYNLTGRVVSIDKSTRSINVDGDAIAGFMAAMTMPYQVKDASVLEKLSPGDQIKAEIVVGDDGAYLENIVPAQKAPSAKPTK
jgi:Cu/Ag efflux protein CusF